MNSDGQPATTSAATLDLQALLASMPDFSMMTSLSNMQKENPNADTPTSQALLFPPIPNEQLAALSLGFFPLHGFPMFPLLPMGHMGNTLPPHSTIESLGLMTSNNLRQSSSSTTLTSAALDTRPRAFSSAAALQRPKAPGTPERRRKRSRKAQEEEQASVLRMLVDEEDDAPLKLRQPPSTKDLDEKLRMDAAKATVLSESSPPPAKRASPERLVDLIEEQEPSQQQQPQHQQAAKVALRRIIRDEDLPDSIGPDSPFRHHPKYQRKQRDSESEVMDGMEAFTALCMVGGYVPESSVADSSEPTPSPKNDCGYTTTTPATATDSPKKTFAEMMEHAICRELVTAE